MLIPRSLARRGWSTRYALVAAAVLTLGVGITARAWEDLLRIAIFDPQSRYMLLLPPALLWMVWVRRQRLRMCRVNGSFAGPALVLLGYAIYLRGEQGASTLLWHGGAILVLVGCMLAVIGRDLFRFFLPPLAALIFLLPLPMAVREAVVQPFQQGLASLLWVIYESVGISVEQAEGVLVVNGINIAIPEVSSGIEVLMALCLLSYLFAFGKSLRGGVRLLILVMTPITVVFCSMLGLVLTTWVLGRWANEHGYLVQLSQWSMLVVAFLVLAGILKALSWAAVPVHYYMLANEQRS